MDKLKKRGGFTLVELIISIGVLLVIMGAVTVVASQMMTSISTQRQRQAQAVYEEQARTALLTMIRDARASYAYYADFTVDFDAGETTDLITFTAFHTQREEQITIIYEVIDVDTDDAYAVNRLLIRTLECASGDPLFGVGEYEAGGWPNPFTPTVIHSFNVIRYQPHPRPDPFNHALGIEGRLEIELDVLLPMFPGDIEAGHVPIDPPIDPEMDFRRWTVTSAVSMERPLTPRSP